METSYIIQAYISMASGVSEWDTRMEFSKHEDAITAYKELRNISPNRKLRLIEVSMRVLNYSEEEL